MKKKRGKSRWLYIFVAGLLLLAGCAKEKPEENITPKPMGQDREENGMREKGVIYVSPNGNDQNAGTKEKPFRTLKRAKEEVAKENKNMTKDIVVYLMDGVYYLDETLTFEAGDSGTNGYSVRYEADENATPCISGGRKLEGTWELHDETENIYRISVPEGLEFRQLYMNGELAVRARTGRPGVFDSSLRIQGAERLDAEGNVIPESWENWNDVSAQAKAEGGCVIVPVSEWLSEDMEGLKHVELHIFTAWCENILRIASIERIGSYDCRENTYSHTGTEPGYRGECFRLMIKEPEAARVFNRPHPNLDNYTGGPHYVFYYENAYRYIDEAGEWYLDTETNTLYYKASVGMDMATVSTVVPVLEELVRIEGTLDNPVCNLSIKGITFEHSTWMRPSEEGLVNAQAGQYVNYSVFARNDVGVFHAPAGITVKNATQVRFEDNLVRFMGGAGILLESGTQEVTLIGNVVEQIAGNGIEIGKFTVDENTDYHTPYQPQEVREVCTNDRILNNIVRNIGMQYEGSVGIAAGYVKGITIANNTVYDCPYTGISVGYGWTNKENPMEDNRILKNEVYQVNRLLCDGGGIYTLSNQEPGSLMAGNYIHDNLLPKGADYSSHGIYMDEQTTGYTVLNNVLVASYGIFMRVPDRNVSQGNHIFEKEPDTTGYVEFLTEEVQQWIKAAGVQKEFEETALFEPMILNTVYEQGYATFRIYGTRFGGETGTVVLETKDGTTVMPKELITKWTENSISFVLPEEVCGKVRVFVETKDNKKSQNYETDVPASKKSLILTENFENAAEGAPDAGIWEVSRPECAEIIVTENGKVLKLKGTSPNLEVYRLSEDGKKLRYGNNMTQYDFLFPRAMSDYTGLYNQLRIDSTGSMYTTNIRPAYWIPLALEQKGVAEFAQLMTLKLRPNTWYTCRTMVYEEQLCIVIFERDGKDPEEWQLTMSMASIGEKDCVLNFSFYDPSGRSVYVDNILVEEYTD